MKRIIILGLTLFAFLFSYGQLPKKKSKIASSVKIEVFFENNYIKDSVHLGYYDNCWGPLSGIEQKNGYNNGTWNSFRFEIKNNGSAAYCAIYKIGARGSRTYIVPYFISEPGDNIKIYVKKDTLSFSGINLVFSGKGALKYECQYKLSRLIDRKDLKTQGPRYTIMKNGEIYKDSLFYHQMAEMFEAQLNRDRKVTIISLKILETYKKHLSTLAYNVLKAEIISKEESSNYRNFSYPFQILSAYPSAIYRSQIEPKIRKIYAERHMPNFDRLSKNYLALSRHYINFMISKTSDTLINKQRNYQELKDKHSGLLRDRVVTAYLLKNYAFIPGLDKEVQDALSYVKTDYCRRILLSFSSLVPGVAAFNFKLPDTSGKIWKLNDFKGKVIIMDFWFTGCGGCANLTRKMKPIAQHFKDNDKVAFVTVSIDRDSEEWKNSIRYGKYTHEGSIDLLSNDVGYNSHIIKHYNIIAYPTLIIVDKDGKVITGNPPRPPKINEFIALIEKNVLK